MKLYIIIDEFYNNDYHKDFVDVFTDPEEALMYISGNQQNDGHLLKCLIKEV
jgi:hypothetical protein